MYSLAEVDLLLLVLRREIRLGRHDGGRCDMRCCVIEVYSVGVCSSMGSRERDAVMVADSVRCLKVRVGGARSAGGATLMLGRWGVVFEFEGVAEER